MPHRLHRRRFWSRLLWRVRRQRFPRFFDLPPLSLFVLHLRSDSAPNPVSIPKGPRASICHVIGLRSATIIGGIMRLFHKNWLAAAMVAVAAVLSVGAAIAQSGGSSISGAVLDPSGAVVANAKVQIHNAVSGYDRTTTTDSKGNFSFPNVPFNPYHMTVTAAGFAQYAQDVEIRSALGVNVKVSLTVAGDSRRGGGFERPFPQFWRSRGELVFAGRPTHYRPAEQGFFQPGSSRL